MHTLYKNATGIRVLYAMGMDDDPIAKKALEDVKQLVNKDNTAFSQAGGEEYLAFHLITETMLQKEATTGRPGSRRCATRSSACKTPTAVGPATTASPAARSARRRRSWS